MSKDQKRITSYEVVDHGFDNCQYFQGCGTSYTQFNHVVTGCGETAREAVNDALEMMAQTIDFADGELDRIEREILAKTTGNIDEPFKNPEQSEENDDYENEIYYYLSIRWL